MKKDRKSKKELNKLPARELQQAILRIFKANPGKNFSASHLIDVLQIGNNRDSVRYALEQLEITGQLKPIKQATYVSASAKPDPNARSKNKPPVVSYQKTDIPENAPAELKGTRGGGYEGKVDMTKSGAGYIVCEGLESDVFVHASARMIVSRLRLRCCPTLCSSTRTWLQASAAKRAI